MRYVVSHDHAGLKAALQARLPAVPWQRCQFHLQQNAMQHVPKVALRTELADDLRSVFNAQDRAEADQRLAACVRKHHPIAPELADWLEKNVPESLTVFCLPQAHRVKMRTTNLLENLNKQVKRRTRVATLFPNEASCLRLVSAVLTELSEEWQTGKVYLNMNVKND